MPGGIGLASLTGFPLAAGAHRTGGEAFEMSRHARRRALRATSPLLVRNRRLGRCGGDDIKATPPVAGGAKRVLYGRPVSLARPRVRVTPIDRDEPLHGDHCEARSLHLPLPIPRLGSGFCGEDGMEGDMRSRNGGHAEGAGLHTGYGQGQRRSCHHKIYVQQRTAHQGTLRGRL